MTDADAPHAASPTRAAPANPAEAAPSVSVIVTTYNRPEALDRVLASLTRQRRTPKEVIVADDGSGPDTAETIAAWAGRFSVPLIHSWQEDKGFRVARSRNLAAHKATGDYIVYLDGDCIALPGFVEAHARAAARGRFVTGRRVFLRDWATRAIIDNAWSPHAWPSPLLFTAGAVLARNRWGQLWPLPMSEERRWSWSDDLQKAETCNVGVWREDLVRVGGFDERYEHHGPEDIDFFLRLMRIDVKRYRLDHIAPVLHLAHGRPEKEANVTALFEELKTGDRIMAVDSIFVREAAARDGATGEGDGGS